MFILTSIYVTITIFIPNSSIVGAFGVYLGVFFRNFFGALSFLIVPLASIYIYYIYMGKIFTFGRDLEVTLSYVVLLLSLLLLQSLLFDVGDFANSIIFLLSPYIGIFGLWVLQLGMFIVSFLVVFNISVKDIIIRFKSINFNSLNSFKITFVNFLNEIISTCKANFLNKNNKY